jgi:hypothetical protein
MNGADMSKETGGPAFPQPLVATKGGHVITAFDVDEGGMTLRDHIAIKEMAAAQRHHFYLNDSDCAKNLATHCYMMADAMLQARK